MLHLFFHGQLDVHPCSFFVGDQKAGVFGFQFNNFYFVLKVA